jgi:type III restriction enzyme
LEIAGQMELAETREHFASRFDGVRLKDFVYERTKLGRVREFATAADIQVMIVTIQSINSANNVFYDTNQEALGDQAAADWVAKTRPILIVDEPQSVEGGLKGAGRKALAAMNPLAMFKYTATPVNVVHTLYRLDAFDAFQLGLVKRISGWRMPIVAEPDSTLPFHRRWKPSPMIAMEHVVFGSTFPGARRSFAQSCG